jgi:isochorismate synthase EntC
VLFLLKTPWGLLRTEAPETLHAAPHKELPSFYCGDFFHSGAPAWAWAEKAELLKPCPRPRRSTPRITWKNSDPHDFEKVVSLCQKEIKEGLYEKIVPAHVFEAEQEGLSFDSIQAQACAQSDSPLYDYALLRDGQLFAGRSPEILFQLEGRQLSTMALAGTSKAENSSALLRSSKDLREHNLVVDVLLERLQAFGDVEREVCFAQKYGPLAHLKTPLRTQMKRDADPLKILESLHPTPALGAAPWNEAARKRLRAIRKSGGVYPNFGAPFGLVWGDKAFFLVAIRNILVEDSKLKLATGCGILKESQWEKEWQELLLKRESVVQSLHLKN